MEFNEEAIVNALHQFYSTTDENVRRHTNDWLQKAQTCPEVWNFAWNLLGRSNSPDAVAIQHFAANCLYHKISGGKMEEYLKRYGANENENSADMILRESLIDACTRMESKVVRNKLSLTLAAYVCYTTPDIWTDAFDDLANRWRSTQPALLLDVLGNVPTESSSMTASVERKAILRCVLRGREAFVAETISSLLQSHCSNEEIVDTAMKCLESWVDFCKDASQWVGIVALCLQCAAQVRGPTLAAVSGFLTRFVENSELRKLENFIGQLFDFLAQLYATKQDNEEEWENIVDMCVALLENNTTFVLKHLTDQQSVAYLVNGAVDLTNSPGWYPVDESTSGKLFSFWYNLYEDALAEQDTNLRSSWLSNIQPIYQRIADVLLTKLKYPPASAYSTWTAADKEHFEKYRMEGGDVLACCARILSSANFLDSLVGEKYSSALQNANSSNPTGWKEVEVILYALESVGDYVSGDQACLQRFFQADLPNAPFCSTVMANTALRMISKYTHSIGQDPTSFKSVWENIVGKFLTEPATVQEATAALEQLTRNGDTILITDGSLCSSIVVSAYVCFGDVRFRPTDQLRALSAAGHALATQPNQIVLKNLNEFLAPRLQRLQEVVEGKTAPCTKEQLLMEFDVLSCLVSSLGSRNHSSSKTNDPAESSPIFLIVAQSFGLFEALYTASGGDADVINKIIDTLKRSLTILSDDAKPLVPQFSRMVGLLFSSSCNVLTLTRPMFQLFANDDTLQSTMSALFKGIAEKLAQHETEDGVELFLVLCHQLAKKQWKFLVRDEQEASYDYAVRLACRTIGSHSAGSPLVQNASQFLCELFASHSDSVRVLNIVEQYGSSLMTACLDRLGVELLLKCVEHVADVLFNLMRFNQQNFQRWERDQHLVVLMGNPIISAMFKEIGNKRKFREYAKQYNIACRKEARDRGV